MTDSKDFTVTVKDSTVKFTATDGKATSLGLDKTEIVYNTATKLSIVELDSKGVELKSTECDGAAGTINGIEYAIDVTSDKGYVTADGLVLNKVGDTAKVTATKHSGVYKDGKEDGNLTFAGTVTALNSADMATGEKWTLASSDVAPYDWSKVKENHDLILNENGYLFMNVKDTKGNDIVKGDPTTSYTVVSMNKDVIFVDDTNKNMLVPNKVGSAVININDKNGNTVWSYLVNVKEARKPATFALDKTSVTLSNATKTAATANVKLTFKDQYGRKNSDGTLVVTNTTKPDGATTVLKTQGPITNGEAVLTFEGATSSTRAKKGNYAYKLELKDTTGAVVYTATLGVTIQEPNYSAKATYSLLLNGENAAATVDETVTADSLDAKTVNVKVGMFYDGVLGDYYKATDSAIKMTTPKNTTVATGSAVGEYTSIGDSTPVDVDFDFNVRTKTTANSSDFNFAQTAAGTYTVTVKVPNASGNGLKDIKQYINVTNNQPAVVMSKRDTAETVVLAKITNSITKTDANATEAAILGAYQFSYDNNALASLTNGQLIANASSADGTKGQLAVDSITNVKTSNISTLTDGTVRLFVKSFDITVPVVFGDIDTTAGVAAGDVVYITQTVNAGYYLQFK